MASLDLLVEYVAINFGGGRTAQRIQQFIILWSTNRVLITVIVVFGVGNVLVVRGVAQRLSCYLTLRCSCDLLPRIKCLMRANICEEAMFKVKCII